MFKRVSSGRAASLVARMALCLFLAQIVIIPLVFYQQVYNTYWIPKNLVYLGLYLILVALVILLLLLRRTGVRQSFHNIILYSALAFQLSLVLATVFSMNSFISFYGSYWRQMGLVVMFPIITTVCMGIVLLDRRKVHILVRLVACFCFCYSLVGILQKLGVKLLGVDILYGRSSGFQGNPDFYAPMLLLLIFPVLSLIVNSILGKRGLLTSVYAVTFLLGIGAVFSTLTRGAWIGFIAGLAFWAFFGYVFFWRKYWKYLLFSIFGLACICVCIFLIMSVLSSKTAAHRENSYDKLKSIINLHNKSGLVNQRLILWRDTVKFSYGNLKKGRIFGCGWENFIRPFMKYKSLELAQISKSINYDNPHNNYIGILAKTGLPGFLAYVCIYVSVFWCGIRFIRKSSRLPDRLWMLGLLSAVAAYAVNLVSIFPTISTTILFFIYVGAISKVSCPHPLLAKETGTPRSFGDRATSSLLLVLLVGSFVISIVGVVNYVELIRADYYFETARKLIIRTNAPEENLDKAIVDLRKANSIYPQEAFYVHELLRAMGMKAGRLSKRGNNQEAQLLFREMLKMTEKYEKTSWTPDILYLTMGVNAYRLGLLDISIAFFNKALTWDHWCYRAHTSLGVFYYFRYKVMNDLNDLAKAFFHSRMTSTSILRYAPYWDKMAMLNTLQYGKELYRQTNEPKILDNLMGTVDVYARYFDDPAPIRGMVQFFKGTKYEKTVWAALIFYEIHIVKRRKDMTPEAQRKRLEELKKELRDQKLKDRFFKKFVEDSENM